MKSVDIPGIPFKHIVFDLAVHPSRNLVVSGLVTGQVYCHSYASQGHELLWKQRPFQKSCRGIVFSHDGQDIIGISRDKSMQWLNVETGQTTRRLENCHEHPLNHVHCLNERWLATGDDVGVIKIWDTRRPDPVHTLSEHEDFIADMAYKEASKALVVVGGDGYLSVWDIRKPKLVAMSDHMEDELLSLALVKDGSKAVVGSQEGVLSIWDWGDWGDYKDRMMGHPNSIEAICKLDEDSICTGSSDGLIRLITIHPNEFHGILGDYGDKSPIDQIRLSHDKQLLLSTAQDESIRFWNVAHLFKEDEDEDEDEDEPEVEQQSAQDGDGSEKSEGEDEDEEDDEDDDDDEEDKDEEEKEKQESDGDNDSDDSEDSEDKKVSSSKRPRAGQRLPQTSSAKKQRDTSFFDDLS